MPRVCDRLRELGVVGDVAAALSFLMHTESIDYWGAAATRVAAVVAGCAIALLVTNFFHSFLRLEYSETNS